MANPNFKMPHSKGRTKQTVQTAGNATIQQWITATETVVMGNRRLVEMVATRVDVLAERVDVLKDTVQNLEAIIAQLIGEEPDGTDDTRNDL